MSNHYNNLTPKQAEILAVISEEAGEVIQAVSKVLRHGFNNKYDSGETNLHALEKELGDLSAILNLAYEINMLRSDVVIDCCVEKREKLHKFLHHFGDEK